MVETYTELNSQLNFHVCNINKIASALQNRAEQK